ncbi:TPA: hypothetical protein ACH3X3_008029 [Trebouxia sp. C0006]
MMDGLSIHLFVVSHWVLQLPSKLEATIDQAFSKHVQSCSLSQSRGPCQLVHQAGFSQYKRCRFLSKEYNSYARLHMQRQIVPIASSSLRH